MLFWFILLDFLGAMTGYLNTVSTETHLNAVPVYYWSIQSEDIYAFVNVRVFKVWWMQELPEGIQSQFIGSLNVDRRTLRYAELKDLAFFVRFVKVVTSVKLILCEGCAIHSSQTCWILFLGLIRIGRSYELLPLLYRILRLTTQQKYTALAAGKVAHKLFEIRFLLVLVEQVDGLLLE